MSDAFFTIIIPTYNRASLLHTALESVINQTFTKWELIVIDDGSTDNTKEVVLSYKDKRILYFYQENRERSAARNKGIELSIGKYICFLDSDDYYKNNRLNDLYDEIEKRNFPIAFFYTSIAFQTRDTYIEKHYMDESDIYERIINDIIGTPQVCIHKSILLKYQFNVNYNLAEDLDLWTRIATEFEFVYINNYSVVALEHDDRSINTKENHFAKSLIVIKNIFKNKEINFRISKSTKLKSLSNIYYSIGNFYKSEQKIIKALMAYIKSIFINPMSNKTKHKCLLIIKLILNIDE